MLIGEHEDGIVIELESQDVTFLEDDFPHMGEIDRDLHLYEMMDPDIRSTPKQQLMLEPSGSEKYSKKVDVEKKFSTNYSSMMI